MLIIAVLANDVWAYRGDGEMVAICRVWRFIVHGWHPRNPYRKKLSPMALRRDCPVPGARVSAEGGFVEIFVTGGVGLSYGLDGPIYCD